MRLEELRFERYGAFTDRTLIFRPDARLHVVLGANEAGKTTALAGVGDLLFGFGKRTDYDFLHESKSLRLGARLRLADGAPLVFRRRKGDKNTLLDEADKPLADDLLAPLLGAATRESFFGEFGLTARALREGGLELLKAGGRLAETLAAASAGLSALSRLRARLEAEAEALFGPRRVASKEFYLADSRFAEAEKALREAIVTADALKAADAAVAAARRDGEALRLAHERLARELALRQRAARTRPRLARLDALRRELAELAGLPPVAAGETARWRAALEEGERLAADLAEQAAADAADRAAIADLAVDEGLLARAAEALALRERLGAARKAEADLPRREEALRIARERLAELARKLGRDGVETLLAGLPADPALAGARDSLEERRRAEERHAEAEEALAGALLAARELEEGEERRPHVADPEPLLRRFEAFADIGADADRLRRARAADALEARRLGQDAARLDPPADDLPALARVPLPERGEIEAARRLDADLVEARTRADAELSAARAALAESEAEIERHSRAGAAATREDLAAARRRRESAASALEAGLDGDADRRRGAFERLLGTTREADAVADILLSDADRASRLEAARERLAGGRRRLAELLAAEAGLAERRAAADAAWAALWARSGVAPRAPAAMAQWLARIEDLLERRRRLEDRASEAAALEEKLAAHRDALARLLIDLGGAEDPFLPVEALHKEAGARLAQLQRGWTEARERAVRRQNAREEIGRREAARARAETALEEARARWPARMAAIGLLAEASVAEAEAALAVWREVPPRQKEFEELTRRIRGMAEDMAAFAADVAALVGAAAPDLAALAPLDALAAVNARLEAAHDARGRRDALAAAIETRRAARAALTARRAGAEETLRRARATLNQVEPGALAEALARLERRDALAAEILSLRRDLPEIGDGLDEEALRAEQSGLDADLLASEIEGLKAEQKRLVADIEAAAAARHEAEASRERLAAGRNAEGAARERAEAGAALLGVAERWLTRAAAARLAARAIERHRAAAQDPLILRASTLFALATAGAFSGLCVDYDESDAPTLAGRRPDGARAPVTGLSEGARDQLFLALRLALLELRGADPLPFIGDDLLASFDETRVARALGLLAEFGAKRQAILFTHHRHVADIAKETLGESADVLIL